MQLAPSDFQAWAAATGSDYPATPADKAAVYNDVAAWKASQQSAAAQSRGSNAISPLAVGAGTAGLGLAGLLAFNHFRRQGLSEPAAAQLAKNAENQAANTATAVQTPPAAPPPPAAAPDYRLVDKDDQNVRPARPGGPTLRADYEAGPTAATQEIRGGRSLGGSLAREQGQYKARTDEGFHNPALQGLDTPQKRNIYLAGVADAHGTDSAEFQQAQQLIAALETTTGPGVEPTSFIAGLSPEQRYGTTTAAEEAATGGSLAQSRTKSNASAQAGYKGRDTAIQRQALTYSPQARANQQVDALVEAVSAPGPGDMGATDANNSSIEPEVLRQLQYLDTGRGNLPAPDASNARRPLSVDPAKASVFFLDADGTYKPYLGSSPVFGKGDVVLSTGRRSDGSPIAESDLAYFPTDDTDFYNRSAISHPFADMEDIELNASSRPDLRFADVEDQGIKGMQESLPSQGARIASGKWGEGSRPFARQGISLDGVSDNWTFGRVQSGGDTVPLDVSGFQSEMESPAVVAGKRLRRALEDHLNTAGRPVPQSVGVQWATSLAQEHGVDPGTVLRVALGRSPDGPVQGPLPQTRALAAGSGDALDRVYNSLGMHAGADAWDLEGMVRSGDLKGAAAALASQLPSLTAVNASGLRGIGQDEKLNIVAEGISAGLNDLHVAVNKYPEAASRFGIGAGPGGFGLDAFLKSYVRDWVTVRGLQIDPTGQPTYQVPNDAFEILAHQAHENGHSTLHEIENHVRGAANGLEGALRLDRLVSAAQSTKEGDPNTNGTNFAQVVFDLKDKDLISTQLTNEAAGDVKLSFGTRRNYDATAGFYDRNPNEQQLDAAIEDYESLSQGKEEIKKVKLDDGTIDDQVIIKMAPANAGYKPNAVLAARVSGADFKTPEGQQQQQRAKDAQTWITANATDLERQRADLNRGIIRGDSGPQSFGRGFVISSDQRGAFLAGDTQGMNTSIREEQFNDSDTTAVDRAQDHELEARLNNQIAEPDGLDVEDSLRAVSTSEADATARQYGSTKLNFKNLGPGSRGAMADGEAFYPRQALRRQAAENASDSALGRILAAHLPSFRFAVQGAAPGYGDDYERFSPTPPTPAGAEERQAAIDLDRRTLQHSTAAPYATVMPKEWRPDFNDPNIQIGVTSAARPTITTTGDAAVAAAQTSALAARGINRGEAFRDDQNFRDHQLVASGYVDRVKAANTAAANASLQQAREEGSISSPSDRTGVGGSQGIAMPPATPRRVNAGLQFDSNELSGLGRSGSTFAQAPIVAAPVSAIPAAAMEQLNTLRSSLERSVPAPITDHEREVARVGHHADYLDKLYALPPGKTPNANLQPVLVGNNRPTPYAEPGEGLLAARVNALRKRGIL